MSHASFLTIGHTIVNDGVLETFGPQSFAGVTLSIAPVDHVPLSQRPTDELLERAAELRQMAATATTPDVVRALQVLADRYVALAKKRSAPGN